MYHILQSSSLTEDSGCHGSSSIGYDWFVATVFLLMNGNKEKAWNLLRDISVTSVSAHLWLSRLHASVSHNDVWRI